MNTNDKTMGYIFKNARLDQKLTQEELAEKAEISAQYLKDIENRGSIPSLRVFTTLVRTLNISADVLIYPNKEANDPLNKKIELLIKQMNAHQLNVLIATAEALLKTEILDI